MRVPGCAMLGLLLFSGCAASLDANERCERAAAPAAIDPQTGTWQLVVPEHADNEFGVPQRVFDLLDDCTSFVSLSHSLGRGGKEGAPGRSELLTSAYGEAWVKRTFGIDNAFRDLARGGGKWVAVGHGTSSPGAIAVADSLEPGTWREVFRSDGFYFNSVAYGANTFVAVTNNGVATSRDGEQWRWADVPSPAQYFEVAFGDGHFVVAGVGATLSSTDAHAWRELRCVDESMCQPPNPPPASACSPGSQCAQSGDARERSDKLALQTVRYVAGKFYAFGASGTLESSDALTFQPAVAVPDAAIGGVLVRVLPSPDGPSAVLLAVSEDDGSSWSALPYELVGAVDCKAHPCVALPVGILAFVAD